MKFQKPSRSFYEIRVEGELGDMWTDWFEGLSIRRQPNGKRGQPVTVLYGPIPDQPALHRVLNKIRDLNLTLLSIRKYQRKRKRSQ